MFVQSIFVRLLSLLSLLTTSTLVVELLTDLPTEFPGSNQLITHPLMRVTLAESKPLLIDLGMDEDLF